jgi:hypothetical protein
MNSNELYSSSDKSLKVISSLAIYCEDCWKLIELKSNNGSPIPTLICLAIPQPAPFKTSKRADVTVLSISSIYWSYPTVWLVTRFPS